MILTMLSGCTQEVETTLMQEYEVSNYNTSIKTWELFSSDLAVTNTDVSLVDYTAPETLYGCGLFDITNNTVYYGDNLFTQLYPASTTKILTAYVALKYGNLDDVITVTAEDLDLPSDSSVCGLLVGDQLTLYDLLAGLLLKSGNDSAMTIARYISGDVATFAELMNSEAKALGATSSNFVNPHGLHDDNHYTTVYDLYIIFNSCIQNQVFLDIISQGTYDTVITDAEGVERSINWTVTNAYTTGTYASPSNVTLLGGKTGYTDTARSCLVLLEEDANGTQYISIVLGAEHKETLYLQMTSLVESLPSTE